MYVRSRAARWHPHPVKLLHFVHVNESTVHTTERAVVTQHTIKRCTTIAKQNSEWKPQFHGAISRVEIAAVVVIVKWEFSGGLSPCEDHSLTES